MTSKGPLVAEATKGCKPTGTDGEQTISVTGSKFGFDRP